jgi:hypothetical protein
MQRFHLVRDYQVVFRVESVRYLFQSVFVGSRESIELFIPMLLNR